jgi:hypothetical protein
VSRSQAWNYALLRCGALRPPCRHASVEREVACRSTSWAIPVQVIRPFAQQGRGVWADFAYQCFQEPLGAACNRSWGSLALGCRAAPVASWCVSGVIAEISAVTDPVNPPHYQGDVECIGALRAALTPGEICGCCRRSAIAYLWRAAVDGPFCGRDASRVVSAVVRGPEAPRRGCRATS